MFGSDTVIVQERASAGENCSRLFRQNPLRTGT